MTPRLPSTVDELIDRLDKNNPAYPIRKGETLEEAHRRAGRREVVQELINLRDIGSTDELESHKRF